MLKKAPNIIFLMPDQLRADYVGSYGHPHALTPNIDALAERGMVYERCLSPSPVCIPARASVLTGHNSLSTGVVSNNFWLRPDHVACGVPSFGSLLSNAGYHTETIGKMHFIPWDESKGFHHRVISEDKRHIHIRDDYDEYLKFHGYKKYPTADEPGYVEGRMASTSLVPLEHQVDKWVGDRSVEFLETYEDDKPFFLWSAFPGPHDPYNPPQEVLDELGELEMPDAHAGTDATRAFRVAVVEATQKGSAGVDISNFTPAMKQKIRRHYHALVHIIDQQVGRIIDALNKRDEDRETLIFFSSDHGDFLGDFDLVGKVLFFEAAMHIPMIAAGGAIKPGRSEALVSLTDMFATFINAAGLTAHCQDSVALPGIGLGDKTREYVMGATDKGFMISGARWKLARYRNGVNTLYDIVEDPSEQNNRFDDSSVKAIRDELDQHLTEWLVSSTMDGHRDKAFPYMTMTPEHPGHGRGWDRAYPANPWANKVPVGLT